MRLSSGIHKGRKLALPKGYLLRPTSSKVRGAIFNICQLTIENASFLDLCAGVGAMGLEALSRGALQTTFVDNARASIMCIEKNIALLKEEGRSRVLLKDAIEALYSLEKQRVTFDIIFVDPPYGKEGAFLSNKALSVIDKLSLLKAGGELFLEDDILASEEKCPLNTLTLKSERRIGRTGLRHFIKN